MFWEPSYIYKYVTFVLFLRCCLGEQVCKVECDVSLVCRFIQTIRAFLPSMLKRNHGCIVAVASAAAFLNFPNMMDYAASKAALVSFMKTLQFEITLTKKTGVTVTCVCPGRVSTGFGNRFSLPGSMAGLENNNREVTVEFAANRIIEAVVNREFVVVFPSSAAIMAYLGR